MIRTFERLAGRGKELRRSDERAAVIEAGSSLGELYGMFLGLPKLVGYWMLGSHVNVNSWYNDVTNNNLLLTNNNGATPAVYNDIVPYVDFNGTNQSLSRADEAILDITGDLTIGGWFWNDALQAAQSYIGKSGVADQGYAISGGAASAYSPSFYIVSTVPTAYPVSSTVTLTASTWYFLVGRFTPSTEVACFVNGQKFTNTTSIPAAIRNSGASFAVGNLTDQGTFLNGRAALCFLCSAALSDKLIRILYNRSAVFFRT